MSITAGAVQAILNGKVLDRPVLKILNMKLIETEKDKSKVRLILTDGETSHSYVVLSSPLIERVKMGEFCQGALICLEKYVVTIKDGRTIIMIVNVTVVAAQDLENQPPAPIIVMPKPKPVPKPANTSNSTIIPINLLNPYQNKWIIKGCIMQKAPIKTWNKAASSGKLFSFTMADDSCDVRVTAFNDDVDRFHDLIQVGKTYTLSQGQVKPANKQYSSCKCDHEISLKNDSEIAEDVTSENNGIPTMTYNFVHISDIKEQSVDACIDVCGIAHEIKAATTIIAKKTGKELLKRDVLLVDRSGFSILLTLWTDDVNMVDNLEHPVIVIRGAIVKDFQGRTLNVANSSMVRINPTNVPDAQSLRGWYQDGGHSQRFEPQSSVGGASGTGRSAKKVTISELSSSSERGDYFIVDAMIANIKKDNILYKSCEKCNKKVIDLNNGLYNCEKCNVESPQFIYRFMMQLNIVDYTSGMWVSAFQECAEKILGVSADTMGELIDTEQKEAFDKIVASALYREDALIKLRVFNDTYNDETRLKASVLDYEVPSTIQTIETLMSELAVENL